jgi:hypothetical protein
MRHISKFLSICSSCALLLAASKIQAEESRVAILYKHFLNGTNNSGRITFEREITFPIRRSLRQTDNDSPAAPRKACMVFSWKNANFFITSSPDHPIEGPSLTNANSFSAHGYDGQSFWSFANNNSTNYVRRGEAKELLQPVASSSQLEIIPKGEVENSRGKFVENPSMGTINGLLDECRRITQFGCSLPIQGQPRVLGSNTLMLTTLNGVSNTVQIVGDSEHPQTLSTSSSNPYRVTIDYKTDTLIIDRMSTRGKLPVSTIKYKIMSIDLSDQGTKASNYSWQTYKAAAGNVFCKVAESGAVRKANITTNGEIEAGQVLKPARPLVDGVKR